jgi:hypothetical protein
MIQGPASSPAASNVGAGTEIISLVMRPGGASKNELMHATRWQWHSIRGFVSFVMRKEMAFRFRGTASATGSNWTARTSSRYRKCGLRVIAHNATGCALRVVAGPSDPAA